MRPFAVLAALLLAGCDGPLSALNAAGPAAGSLAAFWYVMFWGAAVLFLLVMVLFALVMLRPRTAARLAPRTWIILGGLGLPALVLPPLVTYSFIEGERLQPRPGPDVVRIEVEAFQWSWDFRYPEHGGLTTRNVLHIPADTPVDMIITSRDVIHAFWVPRLGGKLDAIPGTVNVLRIEAAEPGTLAGQCAEFCGLGHAGMDFTVIVHPSETFAAELAEAAR